MLNKITMIITTACLVLATPAISFAHGLDSPTPVDNAAGIKDSFTLVDQNGRPVTEKSWPGKYKLVFFGFTSCPDECPVILGKLTAALKTLGDKAAKVQTLFITVDPATDTPKVLKGYLKNFDKSIVGLTGTKKQISAAEDAYKVFASDTDHGVDHSSFVYFVSPDGKLLKTFGTDETAANISNGISSFVDNDTKK